MSDSMTLERFRQEAALRCLQGMLAYGSHTSSLTKEEFISEAMEYAEALVEAMTIKESGDEA